MAQMKRTENGCGLISICIVIAIITMAARLGWELAGSLF